MKVVHKYQPVLVMDAPSEPLMIPAEAKIVHVGLQDSRVTLWAEHSRETPSTRELRVQIFGTGHPIPAFASYLGTLFDGPFVWHCYEVKP